MFSLAKAVLALIVFTVLPGASSKTALLLVDVQECFLENGSLPVPASTPIIAKINQMRDHCQGNFFDYVIKTQDYHPAGHISFGPSHGKALIAGSWQGVIDVMCLNSATTATSACCPTSYINPSVACGTGKFCAAANYYTNNTGLISGNAACTTCKNNASQCFSTTQTLWRNHCESAKTGAAGSGFAASLTSKATDLVIQKGTNKFVDAYSAFMDNAQHLKTSLDSTLQTNGVDTLYVAGIATDVCVKWTVRDAMNSKTGNYTVKVITDASQGIWGLGAPTNDLATTETWFGTQGAQVIQTADVLAMSCPTGSLTPSISSSIFSKGFSAIATLFFTSFLAMV